LVAAYGFDEDAGSTVKDASGKGNHGEIQGAQRTTQGRFGKALLFDGVNDWVTVPDSDSLDLDTGMTIEAWVYPTTTLSSWRDVVTKEQSGGAVYYLAANTDSNKPANGVYIGAEQILYAGDRLEPNKWTHVAATYDGATQRLYVDGTEVGSQPMSGPIQHSNGVLRIGGSSIWGEHFPGYIDEVRIYDRALTGDEIRGDMSTALAKPFVIDTGGDSTGGGDSSASPAAPTLLSAELAGNLYELAWSAPNTPDGGYDIVIDGVDTNSQYRTSGLQASIDGLDTGVEHCFRIQSRYVALGQFPTSEELCVQPTSSGSGTGGSGGATSEFIVDFDAPTPPGSSNSLLTGVFAYSDEIGHPVHSKSAA
jgi:hypothetical protein